MLQNRASDICFGFRVDVWGQRYGWLGERRREASRSCILVLHSKCLCVSWVQIPEHGCTFMNFSDLTRSDDIILKFLIRRSFHALIPRSFHKVIQCFQFLRSFNISRETIPQYSCETHSFHMKFLMFLSEIITELS